MVFPQPQRQTTTQLRPGSNPPVLPRLQQHFACKWQQATQRAPAPNLHFTVPAFQAGRHAHKRGSWHQLQLHSLGRPPRVRWPWPQRNHAGLTALLHNKHATSTYHSGVSFQLASHKQFSACQALQHTWRQGSHAHALCSAVPALACLHAAAAHRTTAAAARQVLFAVRFSAAAAKLFPGMSHEAQAAAASCSMLSDASSWATALSRPVQASAATRNSCSTPASRTVAHLTTCTVPKQQCQALHTMQCQADA